MKEKEMRFRISEDLYDEYRKICISLHLSIPRQTAELIRYFVSMQEDNLEKIKRAIKEK